MLHSKLVAYHPISVAFHYTIKHVTQVRFYNRFSFEEKIIRSFEEKMNIIKGSKITLVRDFLSVSKVDSMLVICWDHLELHEKNVMEM
jgi:hypothetical protein